jgi:hypothetical protein
VPYQGKYRGKPGVKQDDPTQRYGPDIASAIGATMSGRNNQRTESMKSSLSMREQEAEIAAHFYHIGDVATLVVLFSKR